MEVEKIIESPYITIKKQTKKGLKRIEARPDVVVAEKNANLSYTKYMVYCGTNPVGYVALIDKDYGVWVDYIKNCSTDKYSGLGKIADQIEVEHCLNRGLKNFEILSDATPSTLAVHYKRGKRFEYLENNSVNDILRKRYGTYNINIIIERLLKKNLPVDIREIGNCVPMFMPKDLIKKYTEIIKKYPLLKL